VLGSGFVNRVIQIRDSRIGTYLARFIASREWRTDGGHISHYFRGSVLDFISFSFILITQDSNRFEKRQLLSSFAQSAENADEAVSAAKDPSSSPSCDRSRFTVPLCFTMLC